MEFINISKGEYLSADAMTNIYNNFLVIIDRLTAVGYDTSAIVLQDNSVSYDISITEILDKMNAVETNITNIHSLISWDKEYYAPFVWEPNTKGRKAQVYRWIDWQNYVFSVANTTYILSDVNGNIITDINGNSITVLKGV